MLTETKTYNKPDVTEVVSVAQPATSRPSDHYLSRAAQFLATLVQFALIAMVIDYWQLESQPLARLIWLAFAGFIVHHSLPQRFRLPFFGMLSLFAVITAVGHFGPNMGVAWLTGKITTAGFLYHLVPGLGVGGAAAGSRHDTGSTHGATNLTAGPSDCAGDLGSAAVRHLSELYRRHAPNDRAESRASGEH